MIEWDDKYCVGISIIDEEHKEFIDIINKAIVTKENNDNPEGVKEVLREITNYVLTYFKTEEAYMIEFNYPEYQDHKEEHHDFTIKIIAYLDKVIKGDYQIANDILEDLKSWLVNHIQGTDKKFVDCCKENGLK
jgi:hemerythrin